MAARSLLYTLVLSALTSSCLAHTLQAIAFLQGDVVRGSVSFTENPDGQVRVVSTFITGLSPGSYGFHVHQYGDPTNNCLSSGGHFNPNAHHHGGRDHDVRHIGDLGNVVFDADNTAQFDFVDRLLKLNGRESIVGRTLVLHEREDDLGLGMHEDSLTTGNAGARVACGVIGIVTEDMSAATSFRSLGWLLVTLCALTQLLRLN